MQTWHLIALGAVPICWYFVRKRIVRSIESQQLTSRDLSLADQSLKEGLACLGYSLNEAADSPRTAIEAGVAHLTPNDLALGPLFIAIGISKRYADDNRFSEIHAHAIKDLITERYAELVSLSPQEVSSAMIDSLQHEPTLGFLATKAHKDTWTIAAQFRTSSVLRDMMFGRAPI